MRDRRIGIVAAPVAVTCLLLVFGGRTADSRAARGDALPAPVTAALTDYTASLVGGAESVPVEALNTVIQRYCQTCHNDQAKTGNLSLQGFNVGAPHERLATAEKMIRKLRAQMMPPPGMPRPKGDTLLALVETLERTIDRASGANPGTRTFQRLNRPEYEAAVRALLAVEVNAGDYLPLDTKSANFDNIADVQALSPTLLEAYLNAAAAVSRMALGDRNATLNSKTYRASPFTSQHPWDRVEGAPYCTRGGIVVVHDFPADGEYTFRTNVSGGVGMRLEDIDVSVDGARAALLQYERGVERSVVSADLPSGVDYIRTEPIFVRAGQQRISAAFARRTDGPYEDLVKPHDWSLAGAGTASAGTTAPPHLVELTIMGPHRTSGISETASRQKVFSCRPTTAAEERPCATEILTRLGGEAYRRPLTDRDRDALLKFYEQGAANGGFEEGVRTALQALLASPYFVFRFEQQPANVRPGSDYRLSDADLASRLSFFLWGTLPDRELMTLAQQRKLSDGRTLER